MCCLKKWTFERNRVVPDEKQTNIGHYHMIDDLTIPSTSSFKSLLLYAGVPFYSGFGCRGGVSCVQNSFLFRISSQKKYLIFLASHGRIAFYSGFHYDLKLLFIPDFDAETFLILVNFQSSFNLQDHESYFSLKKFSRMTLGYSSGQFLKKLVGVSERERINQSEARFFELSSRFHSISIFLSRDFQRKI